MSTGDREPVRLGPCEEAPYGCPTCRTVVRPDRVPGGCLDLWHSDNRPTREDIRQASAALDEQLTRVEEAQRQVDEIMSRKAVGSAPACSKCSAPLVVCHRCGMVPAQCGETLCVTCTPEVGSAPVSEEPDDEGYEDFVADGPVEEIVVFDVPAAGPAEQVYQQAAEALVGGFRVGSRNAADAYGYAAAPWLRAAVDAAYARGVSEGRRQADLQGSGRSTWTQVDPEHPDPLDGAIKGSVRREWAVGHGDTDDMLECRDERQARAILTQADEGAHVISRLVGPWEPTEQDGDAR